MYWHKVYKIILSEYEWKPCAGPGDAGGKAMYWHRVYKIISAEFEWKTCAGHGDAGGQSCTGKGFSKLF